jgi:DUF1365 family protein
MNSCLYECTVMHHRLEPLRNRFVYRIFMFALDVDELDRLHSSLRLFSRNRFNLFSFRDADHLQLGKPTVRENVLEYLRTQGVTAPVGRILLITNVRVFGYVFNPVSFYYCYDTEGVPLCAVPEVGNTFGEQKPYLLSTADRDTEGFRKRVTKYFYVSPFIDLDAEFDFQLHLPGEQLHVMINDFKEGKKFFLSTVHGERRPLTDAQLAWYLFRFPFITLQVITLIHWQALKLYIRKLPFFRKTDNPELQKEIVVWNK